MCVRRVQSVNFSDSCTGFVAVKRPLHFQKFENLAISRASSKIFVNFLYSCLFLLSKYVETRIFTYRSL